MREPTTSETYDLLAEEYAARAEQFRVSIREALHTHMFPLLTPGCTFLDIGCAAGVATEEAALAGFDAYGYDISDEMIRVARRDRKVGKFYQADYVTMLPRPHPDAMLAFAFVHLFPKNQAPGLFAKMFLDLQDGGYLYAGTTVEEESSEGWEVKADYPDAPPRWRARYTADEFEATVMSASFEPVITSEHRDEFGKLWRDVLVRKMR